jgi:hypothetical protein
MTIGVAALKGRHLTAVASRLMKMTQAPVVLVMSHEAGLDDWMRAVADQLATSWYRFGRLSLSSRTILR